MIHPFSISGIRPDSKPHVPPLDPPASLEELERFESIKTARHPATKTAGGKVTKQLSDWIQTQIDPNVPNTQSRSAVIHKLLHMAYLADYLGITHDELQRLAYGSRFDHVLEEPAPPNDLQVIDIDNTLEMDWENFDD